MYSCRYTTTCTIILFILKLWITPLESQFPDKGPLCFQCTKQRNPYSCNLSIRCAPHEKCYSSFNFHGDPYDSLLWDVGCESDSICKAGKRDSFETTRLMTEGVVSKRELMRSSLIGARQLDTGIFTVCNECCDGDFCNGLPCKHLDAHLTPPSGLVCQACQNVENASKCKAVQRCQQGEACATWTSSNGLLSMDCKTIAECQLIGNKNLTNNNCNVCCNTNFCTLDACAKFSSPSIPTSISMTPSLIKTTENANVSFACKVTGIPPLNVSFSILLTKYNLTMRLGSCDELSNSSSRVVTCHLRNVKLDSSGIVSCTVSENSKVISTNASLVVERQRTPFKIVLRPLDTIVDGSKSTTVSCKVDGYPDAHYQWFQLISGSLVDVQNISSFNATMASNNTSVLEIAPKSQLDGYFLCQAENMYENVSLPFTLKSATNISVVQTPTDIDFDPRGNMSYLSFTCAFNSFPPVNVTWRLFSSPNTSLILNNYPGVNITFNANKKSVTSHIDIPYTLVRNKDTTQINCEANNGYFETISYASIRMLRPPKILTSSATLNVHKGSRFILKCEVDGVPIPDIYWYFFDNDGNPSLIPGVQILDSGQLLIVNDMRLNGTLLCDASNSLGHVQTNFKINITN